MSDTNPGYEKIDVNLGKLLLIGGVSLAFIVVSVVFLTSFFIVSKEELFLETVLKPKAPAIVNLNAAENETLSSYALLDAGKQRYRIPIDRAMELLAAEAFEARVKKGAKK